MIGLEEQIKDTQIHFFTDCQPAIKAAFNGGIPSGKVDIILQIKESVNCLSDSGNDIIVHWVPGHRDIEGNELADCQAKEAANEMVGADTEDFPVMMDKKEAMAEIKRNLGTNGKESLSYLIRHVECRCLQMLEKGIALVKKTGIISLC